MGRGLVQVTVHSELQDYVSSHRLCKQGTTVMFNVKIVNFDTGSYLCTNPQKALAKEDKES